MESLRKMDAVLYVLNDKHKSVYKSIDTTTHDGGTYRVFSTQSPYLSILQIIFSVNHEKVNLSSDEVGLILGYLEKLQYVDVIDLKAIPYTGKSWAITWEGRVMIEGGGFVERHVRKERENRVKRRNEFIVNAGVVIAFLSMMLQFIVPFPVVKEYFMSLSLFWRIGLVMFPCVIFFIVFFQYFTKNGVDGN